MSLRFAGYAALFGKRDAGGDVIRPGAFARTLSEQRQPIPLFWQHSPEQRIGWVERASEDAKGLRVIATIDNPDGGAGAALKQGKANGLSFGYRARGFVRDSAGRVLSDIQLFEVSLVTYPMQHAARVHLTDEAAGQVRERKFNQRHYDENGQFARVGEGVLYGVLAAGAVPAQTAKQPNSSSSRYPARIVLRHYPVRIKLPQSKPSQPDKPVIRFPQNSGIDLPDSVVSKANTLSDAVRTATGYQIHVTSGRRPPHRQAAAMYDNYLDETPPSYANKVAEAEIKRIFDLGQAKGLSRRSIVGLMSIALTEQTKRGIYLSKHMRSNAIDIRTPSPSALRSIRSHATVQSVLVENDHIHIQFR